jgi:hypothetical protein
MSNGAENVNIVTPGLEFDGLPVKIWAGNGVLLGSGIYQAKSGGQATAIVISHSAGGVFLNSIQTFASSPNLFTNFIVDRTTSPTTNVPGSFSNFPVWPGHSAGLGFGNVGPQSFNDIAMPGVSSAPANLARTGFLGCFFNSGTNTEQCSYNNGSFLSMPQVIATGTSTLTSGSVTTNTCQTAITTAATGAATTDAIEWSYATAPGASDGLMNVSAFPTAGNVNFTRCNASSASQTGTAIVINWRVLR